MLVIQTPEGLASVYVPVIVSEDRRTMLSHLARANPWWKTVSDGTEVLALFLAASAYVSPNYYPSRLESPGVVPTWNYVAAEVRGRVTLHDDSEWKLNQVTRLTHHFERPYDPEWTTQRNRRHRDRSARHPREGETLPEPPRDRPRQRSRPFCKRLAQRAKRREENVAFARSRGVSESAPWKTRRHSRLVNLDHYPRCPRRADRVLCYERMFPSSRGRADGDRR
jgi:hypothetical protein